MNASDYEKIVQLRDRLSDQLTTYYDRDFNLLRWLQGYNYDVDVIVPKLRNHLRFRKSCWQLDQMVANGKRDHPIHEYWPAGITGLSGKLKNVIVNIEQSGSNDYWGMLATYPLNEIMHARVYDLEMMLKNVMDQEEKTGEQAWILYVMDLNGLQYNRRLMQLMTGALQGISQFMAEHYVEMIHSFVLINVPSFIQCIWKIAHPLLPERTKNKVRILGDQWRTDILQYADAQVLPSYWNDEKNGVVFGAQINVALPINQSNYYRAGIPKNCRLLAISPGKSAFISIKAEIGQTIKWLYIGDGQFANGIFFVDTENVEDSDDILQMQMIYPQFQRIPTNLSVPICDSIRCNQSGVYKFWFSNEHAWWHTLKIHYTIDVTD